MTLNGDIGKTFSGLKNFAVLQGFFAKIRKLTGDYKPSFLTTKGELCNQAARSSRSGPRPVEQLAAAFDAKLTPEAVRQRLLRLDAESQAAGPRALLGRRQNRPAELAHCARWAKSLWLMSGSAG